MPSFFSRLKGAGGGARLKSKKGGHLDQLTDQLPPKPLWEDAYTRVNVEPEEIQELIRRCTEELKARALDHPFLLLPFRPTSDPSAVRTFIRHFFDSSHGLRGDALAQDLRMTEPMVIAGVTKWCWSRLQGGVVGWDAYELFKVGEHDSNMARDSFKTFIPLSVDNGARSCIIFDFFDLLAAIAAHGKMNGMGGRKLSRMAAWWAFEQKDTGSGFEGGYNAWQKAADATSHLFFAYLRSLAPQNTHSTISMLPMSLQKLVQETEYPPQKPILLQTSTNKVVMIVDTVSPTPFALLRRASHFQFRDEDRALQEFSDFEDPVQALTEECRRVLKSISSANQSQVSSVKHSTSLRDASWSRFEDIGFASALEEEDDDEDVSAAIRKPQGLRTTPLSGTTNLARPTTPSWADFLSSGFVDEKVNSQASHLLPPDKVLPPIETTVRQKSSQSHRPRLESDRELEPGELASIIRIDLDDAFWWVWMSSLAPEETSDRKSAFGRCAVIETVIKSGRWLVMEEMVVGAAPEPQEGAYIAEKKGFFSWTRRNKGVNRRKSTGKQALDKNRLDQNYLGASKTSIGPDQQARIAAAAAQLQARQNQEQQARQQEQGHPERRGRADTDLMKDKTNSVLTLQPVIMKEASPAMKWASKYDKDAIREAYLANSDAGRGVSMSGFPRNGSSTHLAHNGHSPGYEHQPQVPPKASPVPSQTVPVAQPAATAAASTQKVEDAIEEPRISAKEVEAPQDPHPSDRQDAAEDGPVPPAKDPVEPARGGMASPEPDDSHDIKMQKKLQKENKAGGFRKLFSRRNRSSKLPENASADLQSMLEQHYDRSAQATPEPAAVPAPVPEVSKPLPQPQAAAEPEPESAVPSPRPAEVQAHEDAQQTPGAPAVGRTPEQFGDNLSRVDTEDANEAHREFSRFDQGPLVDQPAFVPADDDSDDAVPPPIARRVPEADAPVAPEPKPERHLLKKVPTPAAEPPKPQLTPAQDRWAQIRKNAAERAAQRQNDMAAGRTLSKTTSTTDGDDETSGEETIESRVARIKARVAELTGNMEGSTSPAPAGPGQIQ
ncbi:DUF1708-domain-containing protein [Sodiomyces alkalinus F11]|uniref:DUF1708-domain-containing protein n=1 Tax=Sodiomyces alkalinus (strain CBS 110278 / VKM F-3762 / F11) TaxID=1314773 RepID=A0A3N2Q6D2_SODAK|nr:DUF1708-domain-containing protein [Sodiomyces alkalinus F11]ROT42324.1 DUF1708-domain-containing protein [Sodiomyces alkalinus F11]